MYMNYITTTQLRTQTSAFVEALLAGKSIDLIHRSKNLGAITLEPTNIKTTNHARLSKNIEVLALPYLTQAQIKNNYKEHMTKKYGQSLSWYQLYFRHIYAPHS